MMTYGDRGIAVESFRDDVGTPIEHREPAQPVVRLVASLTPGLRLDGPTGRTLSFFVVGMRDRPLHTWDPGSVNVVDAHLDPLVAAGVLGVPVGELTGEVVRADELLGTDASWLLGRLAAIDDDHERAELVGQILRRRAARPTAIGPAIRPEVVAAWHAIRRSGGTIAIDALVAASGLSATSLRREFATHIGVGPKLAARIVRFGRATALLEAGRPPSWAAVDAGYHDVAHLHRDARQFAGTTPGELVVTR